MYRAFYLSALVLTAIAVAEPVTTQDEFLALARDLAPKVNLFRDAWAADPGAEFFGGTSRDYLYWVKRQLKSGKTSAELRALSGIDVREFIVRDSDVDIVASRALSLSADVYGVKKIDYVSPARLDSSTEEGRSERDQGYIPVEKIRLSKNGVKPPASFGDGAGEVWSGRLTVSHADPAKFWQTSYAKQGRNHPALLALRYLRQLATSYYAENGGGAPAPGWLAAIDPASADRTRKILREASRDPSLAKLLVDPAFSAKVNETIQKAFRSYTNPTAARELYLHFGADALVKAYDVIQPINQYLFARPPLDAAALRARLAEYGVTHADTVVKRFKTAVAGGKVYHGTKTEESFESILFTGILPSTKGSAGSGLYTVPADSIVFAEQWGGSRDRLVAFDVKDSATYIDITQGEGMRLFEAYRARTGKGESEFAEYFGADALKYPYAPWNAFVIKNSAAVGFPEGHTRQLFRGTMKLHQLAQSVKTHAELERFLQTMKLARLTSAETDELLKLAGKGLTTPADKTRFERVRLATPNTGELALVMTFYGALDAYLASPTPALEGAATRRLEALLDVVKERRVSEIGRQVMKHSFFPRDAFAGGSAVGRDPIVKALAAGASKDTGAWLGAWVNKQPTSDGALTALRRNHRRFAVPCAIMGGICGGLGAGLLHHWFGNPRVDLLGLPIGLFVFYNTYVDGWNKVVASRNVDLRRDLFTGSELAAIRRAVTSEPGFLSLACSALWKRVMP